MIGTDVAIRISKIFGYEVKLLHIILIFILSTILYIYKDITLTIYNIVLLFLFYILLKDNLDRKKIIIVFIINYISNLLVLYDIYPLAALGYTIVFFIMQYLIASLFGGFVILAANLIFLYISNKIFEMIIFLSIWIGLLFLMNAILTSISKRIFGVSVRDISSSFFFSWFYGEKDIEDILDSLGKNVTIKTRLIAIKIQDKTVYIVIPGFHFGPFADFGSSSTPKIFSEYLNNVIVLHSLYHHDYDIVKREYVIKHVENILNHLKKLEYKKLYGEFKSYRNNAVANVIYTNLFTLIGLTRAPDVTEDIKSESEYIFMSKLNVDNPILYDQHDSDARNITYFSKDSKEFQEYLKLMDQIKQISKLSPLKGAYFKVNSLNPTISSNGINVLILATETNKFAIVNIDGNGINKESRERLIQLFKKYGIEPIISTTDSHENNDISGIINDVYIDDATFSIIESNLKSYDLKFLQADYLEIEDNLKILGNDSSIKLLVFLTSFGNILKWFLITGFLISFIVAVNIHKFK
jgi:predicted neutral ceramidase superfamily lipid hydrolase